MTTKKNSVGVSYLLSFLLLLPGSGSREDLGFSFFVG